MKTYDLSIAIPSWKNPKYLSNCISSLLQNSSAAIQIIVYLNENCPESTNYLRSLNLDNIVILGSDKNEGICVAVNEAAAHAKAPYFVYMNDDMYVLPDWDLTILERIHSRSDDLFLYSGTMIEPIYSSSPSIHADFGQNIETFNPEELLQSQHDLTTEDWSGASWPPTVVSLRMWNLVGGYSLEYSPGFYSDPDFSMKLFQAGVRDFRGLGSSLIYHFAKVSTSRIPKSRGRQIFFCKWKMSSSTFYKYVLQMGRPYEGPITKVSIPLIEKIKNLWKRLRYSC